MVALLLLLLFGVCFQSTAIMPTIDAFKLPILEVCLMTDFKVTTLKHRVHYLKVFWEITTASDGESQILQF